MCEQTETNYLDGDVVWVKLGSCWWPGEVVGPDKLPPDVLPSFRKPPIAVVKFYQEDTYEYVKNTNAIYKYNCSRKNEFINKGLYMFRTKHGHMEKFPEDVIRAETAVGGDIEILTRDEFQETKKESYAGLFGDTKKTPGSTKRGKGRPRLSSESSRTPIRKIKEKTDYKVHILVQGSKTPSNQSSQTAEPPSTPSTSGVESEPIDQKESSEDNPKTEEKPPVTVPSTPTFSSTGGNYSCHACSFSTTRLNVLILHNKTHSVSFTPYTPSPVRKKPAKPTAKSTPTTSKTPKVRRPRKEKSESSPIKSSPAKKRSSQDEINSVPEVKKPKTDEEIKTSLLADWDDVDDEESNDDSSAMVMAGSPEIAVAAESPAVPTPAELPSAQVPADLPPPTDKKSDELGSDKAEPSSDSKYEFCEDEDWSLETDAGRKIPRVTNPSKRKDDIKSLSLDEDDVAREVAELLNKTTVPELPSVPDSLKVEENFPEPSIVKSPDKKPEISPEISKSSEKAPTETQPSKAIFKTKTFFRSRHSRSQDAIGKYVAEQLNAVERMDMSEGEINGSDAVSSPEARDSPPIEPVKVARLAPKIQLKKMKAEAAQLREKEKNKEQENAKNKELLEEVITPVSSTAENKSQETVTDNTNLHIESDSSNKISLSNAVQDVLYPTQEIKPVNEEASEVKCSFISEDNKENITQIVSDTVQDAKETFIDSEEVVHKEEIISENLNSADEELSNSEEVQESVKEKPVDHSPEPYMNESTASAVDALLSVSRDADRVTRVISDDPPEDLFEDDNKDSVVSNTVNGFNEIPDESIVCQNSDIEQNKIQQVKDLQMDYIVGENLNNINKNFQKENSQVDINNDKIKDTHIEDELSLNNNDEIPVKMHTDNIPSESDLQIAETLLNLPATAIQSKTSEHQDIVNIPIQVESQVEPEICTEMSTEIIDTTENMEVDSQVYDIPEENKELHPINKSEPVSNNDNMNLRFETEQEKTENALNAAQSLVQMSESIDHKMNVVEPNVINDERTNNETPILGTYKANHKNGIDKVEQSVEQKVSLLSTDNTNEPTPTKTKKFETTSSKLLKMLEEPIPSKVVIPKVTTTTKQIIIPGKEKILNFDVAKSLSGKSQSPVIIRRAAANKTLLNNIGDLTADKIILSRNNKPSQDGSSVQTYTMKTTPDKPSDANTITIIQQKIRKVPKTPTKLQKPKFQASTNSLVSPLSEPKILNETPASDDAMFDINSMPIVLSDDLLTPESIEKMPIVMSDGNLITNTLNPPKLVKTKQTVVEPEKIAVTTGPSKPEVKTLLMNPVTEVNKITTPNILSKSSKLRSGAKPMLVIDKATGNKKIIVTKTEPPIKEIKQAPTIIQQVSQNTGKAEKFIILPTANSPRPGRTQKIVIDPQTGKAHVLMSKGPEPIGIPENKPVSAKLVPSTSDTNSPGNTVMIITNAQGAQSRIVLTPEHEKILFPNKQQPNISQLKTITQRASPSPGNVQKILNTAGAAIKTQTKIVPKQKSTIITSKGQLIVGGRVAATAPNIAAMPEIRPTPKRMIAAEPKKVIQTIQKPTSEPLIFLQQKSGAVVQLTASQFEHFKRTGQIVQKSTTPIPENKIIVQKTRTISPIESGASAAPKPRIRKTVVESPTPTKKVKQEIAIAPAPPPAPAPVPALAALSGAAGSLLQASATGSLLQASAGAAASSAYPDLDNFEELLPSTAIARATDSTPARVEMPAPVSARLEPPAPAPVPTPAPAEVPAPAPAPAPLSDGQLLAVPGEHFGGPPGSFYLCVEDNGTLTPIDNRPLVLENNQLVPMAVEPLPMLAPQPERRDILEAALANSDVFHAETPRDDAPDFRDLNANVSVHCRVSETSTTLNQPIMTPVEVPSKGDSEPTVPSNLEDGLAVIGVTPHTVPTSLELPITVTDPRIAPKTTDPLSGTNYGTTLLPSPNTEMTFVSTEEVVGPISMPLLTEEAVGKSMPILTEEVAERAASSLSAAERAASSLSSAERAASSLSSAASPEPDAADDDGQWSRRLLTPGSDTSEASAEIPLQPAIQLSVDDLERHS